MREIPIELLRSLLDYNSKTGELFWKPRPLEMFHRASRGKSWNKQWAGKQALTTINTIGGLKYLCGVIFGKKFYAHRVIWVFHFGIWPENEIDHINGDASDNRIVNLRSVAHAENMKNTKTHKNNSSGTCGICWDKGRSKWAVTVGYNRIGRFDSKPDAIAARIAAETAHGYHPNHGRPT